MRRCHAHPRREVEPARRRPRCPRHRRLVVDCLRESVCRKSSIACRCCEADRNRATRGGARDGATGRHRGPGRGQRGDGQPGAQRQARASPTRPARRCSPRSTCSATSGPRRLRRSSRRARRARRPRAGQPDLPGVRPGHRDGAGPARATRPVLCTQTPGGVHEDEYVADAARARRRRDHLRLRPARRRHRRPRPLPGAASSAGCRSSWSTATSRASTRPFISQRRRRLDGARRRRTSSQLGPHPDRAGRRARPVHPGAPQDRGLPRGDARAGSAATTSSRGSSARCSASRAAAPRPRGCSTRGAPRSSAART